MKNDQGPNQLTDFLAPEVSNEGPVRTSNIPREKKRRVHRRKGKRKASRQS